VGLSSLRRDHLCPRNILLGLRAQMALGAAMFLATSNKPKQLLLLSYVDRVSVEELEQGHDDVVRLLDELASGFRVLADLSRLEIMDANGAREIAKVMELCDQKGVGLIVRIIPDPGKDIGMNILSLFHYRHHPRIVTCQNLVEAGEALALGRRETPDDSAYGPD
jgi:hypothetical protein